VLLDSDNEDNKVIAGSVQEFLQLLAFGSEAPGRHPTLEPEDPEGASNLRGWLFEEFNLETPEIAAELVEAAQRQHPDLAAWLRQQQHH